MHTFFTLLLAAASTAISVQAAPALVCPPITNDATINLIKEFEGFVPRPAGDPIGLPTVGYGHRCRQPGCAEVSLPLTEATASDLLRSDLPQYTTCLNNALNDGVRLNDNQFGALTSWTFNVGCGNVRSSTLVQRLNRGEDPNTVAASELPQWRLAGGKVMPGLERRRAAEVNLFKTPSNINVIPC